MDMSNPLPPPAPPSAPVHAAPSPADMRPQNPVVPVVPSQYPPQVQNTSQPNPYVGHSALTTSSVPDLINSKNPFQYDLPSSLNFQRIGANVPNAQELHGRTLQSIRKQKSISESLMSGQKGAQTSESLIAKMYFSDETLTSAPMLQCQSVQFTPFHGTGAPPETTQHIGVRAMITNRRLVFVDSTKNTLYTLQKANLQGNSVITPFRKGETYQTVATITDDLWFKPLPLPTITGVEIYTSHRSEASQYVANRVAPYWFFSLVSGLIGYLFAATGLYNSLEPGLEITLGVFFPTLLLVLAAYFFVAKAQVKTYSSINSVTKSREIRIGAYDPIHNRPTYISMKVEDSQPLASIFHWCRELQDHSPRLSGNQDPLILM